jgi:hypothetical protein
LITYKTSTKKPKSASTKNTLTNSYEEAKENLIDAITEMQKPIDISSLPKRNVVLEDFEV